MTLTSVVGPRKETDNDEFRDWRRRLFHGCLKKILQTLEDFITEWDLVRCADDHFRRVIYGIGPYIADYPEQVLVAGIVSGWCPAYVNSFSAGFDISLTERSCDADPIDLDDPDAEPRTEEKREILLQTKDVDALWFQHGLIHDFRVCHICAEGWIQLNHP